MPLSFPLSREAFVDLLPVADCALDAPAQIQSTGLGGGEILGAELAPALWQGSYRLRPMAACLGYKMQGLLEASLRWVMGGII